MGVVAGLRYCRQSHSYDFPSPDPTAKAWDADKVLSNRVYRYAPMGKSGKFKCVMETKPFDANREVAEGTRSKRIRPQTEQKASPTGKPPPQKKSATSETKSAGKAPGSKKGSKKGAKKAASKVAAKSRARKLTYTPERQDDAPAAEEAASAAEAKAEEAKAAATAAAAKDGSTGETGGFVHDQQEKGGARSQDEVLKDLPELSKISAAKAGLLGADTVLRLDNETPEGPKPLGPTLNGKEDDVRVIDVTLDQGEPDAAAKEGNNDPPMPGSRVSTRAQALRKSNLTFIIKPTTQYYYKFAPSASPEEQRDKMKALVIAYTVHNGPDEADAEVAYFAWLPEGQYWSNLGLDLVLDFVVTKQVPPEVVFLIGPGRQLAPEKPGTPAPKAFKVKKRQLLVSVRATVPGVEGKVIDDLRFCEEEDIDPVATKKYWDPGGPTKEFLKKAVDVLVEPHIHFANGTWPASAPLPGIPPYRRNLAPSPERSVAASTPVPNLRRTQTMGNCKHREQKGPSRGDFAQV